MHAKLAALFPLLVVSTLSLAEEERRAKRSIVIGRGIYRPTNWEAISESEFPAELQKRSMALGRLAFRPGKRSLALGRVDFRPGKRNVDIADKDIEYLMEDSMGKRSAAFGRFHFRPGKRSLALGRSGFRPGKRSLALGRVGFRPGKRASGEVLIDPCSIEIDSLWGDMYDIAQLYEEISKNCGKV
uniref:Neuropeptide-like protein 2 n=1 Tax=Ascaris suum TaxID=6253 RepID=A0A2S1VVM5_ASCSU|nr:neuropeptide-like protein precursor 2 [Ascaris suum]